MSWKLIKLNFYTCFFGGAGYVQSIVHNFIRHSAQKRGKCPRKLGFDSETETETLCVSSFFLGPLIDMPNKSFSSLFPPFFIEISNVSLSDYFGKRKPLISPWDMGGKSCQKKEIENKEGAKKSRIYFISCGKLCLCSENLTGSHSLY